MFEKLPVRWRWSFPELELFPSDRQRAEAWRRASKTVLRSGPYNLLFLGALLALFVLVRVGGSSIRRMMSYVTSHVPIGPDLLGPLLAALSGGLMVGAGLHLFRRRIRRSLRQQLIEIHVPICLECGYDLRGQVEPRCPECGKPFNPNLLRAADDQAP